MARLCNRIWWVHYWPETRQLYTERVKDGGHGKWRTLTVRQADRVVSVVEGLIAAGKGTVLLPRYAEERDWVWTTGMVTPETAAFVRRNVCGFETDGLLEAAYTLTDEIPRGRR